MNAWVGVEGAYTMWSVNFTPSYAKTGQIWIQASLAGSTFGAFATGGFEYFVLKDVSVAAEYQFGYVLQQGSGSIAYIEDPSSSTQASIQTFVPTVSQVGVWSNWPSALTLLLNVYLN